MEEPVEVVAEPMQIEESMATITIKEEEVKESPQKENSAKKRRLKKLKDTESSVDEEPEVFRATNKKRAKMQDSDDENNELDVAPSKENKSSNQMTLNLPI